MPSFGFAMIKPFHNSWLFVSFSQLYLLTSFNIHYFSLFSALIFNISLNFFDNFTGWNYLVNYCIHIAPLSEFSYYIMEIKISLLVSAEIDEMLFDISKRCIAKFTQLQILINHIQNWGLFHTKQCWISI